MFKIKGICEYDGSNFSGWQKQSNSITIQGEIERALQTILKSEIKIIGAGRTDSGVHALNQVFHFQYADRVDISSLKHSLNSLLPDSISIKSLEYVDENFHARYSAKKRTYLYVISKRKNVFLDKFSWRIYSELNFSTLNLIQNSFLGKKDFSSFCKAQEEVRNKVCEVYYSKWFCRNDFLFYFISADRFIHGMVRGIVGLSIELALNKLSIEDFQNVLNGIIRCPLWAPSKGLILYNVEY